MEPEPQQDESAKRRRPRRRRWRALGLFVVLTAVALSLAYLLLPGRQLEAPAWMRQRIEARIERNLNGMQIEFGAVHLVINQSWRPRLGLRDVVLTRDTGEPVVQLADAQASLAMRPLLRGQVQPKQISLSGLFATLRRDADTIALSFDQSSSPLRQAENLPALIEQWDATLATPVLAALTEVETQALTLRYEDARSGRVWTLDGGHLRLDRRGGDLDVSGGFSVLSGRDYASSVELSYKSKIGDQAAEFGVVVREVASEDIAAQAPALGWLGVLRAPISGSMRGGVSSEGSLLPLAASLQIGAGVLQPDDEALPVPFSAARSYFSFDPTTQTLQFDELFVDSGWGSGTAVGQAVLNGISGGRLDNLVGQFTFSNLSLNPLGLYNSAIGFEDVRSDFKLDLNPFRLQIGEMLIDSGPSRLRLSGDVSADHDGWIYALDSEVGRITLERVTQLWPELAAVKPRAWVMKNIHAGVITSAQFSLRGREGEKPVMALNAAFEEAEVTFQKHMPPATGGAGQLSLMDKRFVVMATAGRVQPEQGGPVAVARTSFIIPDVSIKKASPGIARIKARGDVTAALSLLNRPPLSLMDKASLPVALADGQVEIEGTLSLPMRKKVPVEEILYHYKGLIRGVESAVLVPNHVLAAPRLQISGDQSQVTVRGNGTISGLPASAVWTQTLGAKGAEPGRVNGEVELSQAANTALGIGLPDGTLSGLGSGRYVLDLPKGQPPQLTLTSDLAGLGLRIPAIGWSKPAAATGALSLTAALATPARVEDVQISAAGLQASGQVLAAEGGGLDRAVFDTVKVANWMEGPVELIGRGAKVPEVRVGGGVIDLRNSPFSAGGSSSGGGSTDSTGPIRLRLSRLQVTDGIALHGFQGDFSTLGGLNGSFTGNLNGQSPIGGTVVSGQTGVAVRVSSKDAGASLRAAGLLRHASGGSLDMTLLPSGTAGEFNGRLRMKNIRVTEAPSMAALLNAISLVGLLDELAGKGILFTEVESAFRLGPSYVQVNSASAVGPSLGLSLDGYFNIANSGLNMRGVLSPIYMLNVVGRPLARKGEGLIGFAFSLGGTTDNPQVSVNPLSALMPGVLRDLMRRKQPVAPGSTAAEPAAPQPEAPRRHGPADNNDR